MATPQCFFASVLALILAQGALARRPAIDQAQQPRVQGQSGRPVPDWVTKPQTEVDASFVFVGRAQSISESQARDNAYKDAINQAIADIAKRLFADQNVVASSIGIDSLREYLVKATRLMDTYVAGDSIGRGYRAFAQLQLTKAFAEPGYLRQYAVQQAASQPDKVAGYLLVPTMLDGGRTNGSRRIQVRSANSRRGSFVFTFTFKPVGPGAIGLRLDQILVVRDGSGGSTSWAFDVAINGNSVITVPATAYNEEVGTYRMPPGDQNFEKVWRSSGQASGSIDETLELRIIGTPAGASAR